MRPNRSRLSLAPCFLLALLPFAGACTREPAESTASATAPAASPASPTSGAPAASAASPSPAPALGSEPSAPGVPAAAPAVPLAGVRSTAIAHGHVVLTGDYQADADSEVTCAVADTALQLTLLTPGKPRVLIFLEDLASKAISGTYKGRVTIAANDPGESSLRQSEGKASSEVTVEEVEKGKAVSGSFSTTFTGDAGKGTVKGRFDRCVFKPEPADHP